MIKKTLIALFLILLAAVNGHCFQPEDWQAAPSRQTDDATIHTGVGWLYGIWVETDGTNDVTVTIYDNTAASGTKIGNTFTVEASKRFRAIDFGNSTPVPFNTGLTVDVTTAGTVEYTVFYRGQ